MAIALNCNDFFHFLLYLINPLLLSFITVKIHIYMILSKDNTIFYKILTFSIFLYPFWIYNGINKGIEGNYTTSRTAKTGVQSGALIPYRVQRRMA